MANVLHYDRREARRMCTRVRACVLEPTSQWDALTIASVKVSHSLGKHGWGCARPRTVNHGLGSEEVVHGIVQIKAVPHVFCEEGSRLRRT